MHLILLTGLLLVLASICTGETGCPDAKSIEPCICEYPQSPYLTCDDIREAETLKTVFSNLKRYFFQWVKIRDSILNYIPHEMFDGITINSLELENVTLTDIFDEPPKNLQSLKVLRLKQSKVLRGVVWQLLSPLTELEMLEFYNVSIKVIKQDFSQYASKTLKHIVLENSDTRSIKPGVFQKFENLEKLYVEQGHLLEIRRDFFPTPFASIKEISFTGHKIKSIPDGMFTDMPNLRDVQLMNNTIEVVNSDAFDGRADNLTWLTLYGNPLRCDCRIYWLIKNRPRYLYGKCEYPEKLRGKELMSLTDEDLPCT